MGVEIIRIKAVLSSTGLELELSLAIFGSTILGKLTNVLYSEKEQKRWMICDPAESGMAR